MNQDIDRFVKDPSLLIELCRDVIDRIDCGSNNSDTGEKEAQLREIAKAVEKLEKMGVPVPDPLRREKLRLATIVNTKSESRNALHHLLHELEKMVSDLRKRLWKEPSAPKRRVKIRRRCSSDPSQTPRQELMHLILVSLKELGGSADCNEVLQLIEKKLQGKFLPGDLEDDDNFGVKWRHNVHWARLKLANDGDLIKDSPRGFWQLSKRHK
ncbi:MAG TPA: hypothetical protein ENK96_04420 [Desulfobulbaceae bacterium]|nr:hypothetical protein [Desulfobulbaceae bacterium]